MLSACNSLDGIKGEDTVATKFIENLLGFNTINISKELDVKLTTGNKNSAIIKANKNLLEVIKVFVENNTLYITSKKISYRPQKKVLLPSKI